MKTLSTVFFALIFFQGFSQTVSVSESWKPKKGENVRILPAGDGTIWVTAVDWAAQMVRVDQTGLIATSLYLNYDDLAKSFPISFDYYDSALRLCTHQYLKKEKVSVISEYTVAPDGKRSNKREIWRYESDGINNESRVWIRYAADSSHILIADYFGKKFAVLDRQWNLKWEGSLPENKLIRTKQIGVNHKGDVALITFTNQKEVFESVDQEINIVIFAAGSKEPVSTPMGGAPEGSFWPTDLKIFENRKGEFVAWVEFFTGKVTATYSFIAFTEINLETGNVKRRVSKIEDGKDFHPGFRIRQMEDGTYYWLQPSTCELLKVDANDKFSREPLPGFPLKKAAVGQSSGFQTADGVECFVVCAGNCEKQASSGKIMPGEKGDGQTAKLALGQAYDNGTTNITLTDYVMDRKNLFLDSRQVYYYADGTEQIKVVDYTYHSEIIGSKHYAVGSFINFGLVGQWVLLSW